MLRSLIIQLRNKEESLSLCNLLGTADMIVVAIENSSEKR